MPSSGPYNRLHCTTHHRYKDEGLCLLTCKELRFFFKSMSVKNVSRFGQYFRRLATLNSYHITGVFQSLALFTNDYAGLLQLSKNCMGIGGEKGQRGQSHITTHKRTDTSRVSGVHKYEGLVQRVNNQEVIGGTHYITHIGTLGPITASTLLPAKRVFTLTACGSIKYKIKYLVRFVRTSWRIIN